MTKCCEWKTFVWKKSICSNSAFCRANILKAKMKLSNISLFAVAWASFMDHEGIKLLFLLSSNKKTNLFTRKCSKESFTVSSGAGLEWAMAPNWDFAPARPWPQLRFLAPVSSGPQRGQGPNLILTPGAKVEARPQKTLVICFQSWLGTDGPPKSTKRKSESNMNLISVTSAGNFSFRYLENPMMKRNCQHSPKKAIHSLGTRDSEEKHLSTSKRNFTFNHLPQEQNPLFWNLQWFLTMN